ncbi:hypothetical protein AKJ39_02795 [candidate division MSBL1 archaeon SCGC-AAA259J03]|uniref:CAAX prenyl protease 2/Lysostaphin resistance protein A-like domain-containing protein n=1 Tax=candidate division MSBL1 archaeon SCGC-AAA259J03 TaxID=1698269 RepID=A0A656YWM3_9EURY|nr:hypothetical protein AKJ39_02795 [candidate division MSBL1 archaeon SCGC-AAA259J03]
MPVVVGESWLEYSHPLLFLPVAAVPATISFLVGSGGAIVTIPLGLAVSRGLKENSVPLLSGKAGRKEKVLKTLLYGIVVGVLLFGVTLAGGLLGGFLGEPLPKIEEVFVIPVTNAAVGFPWLVAVGCFSLAVGVTEEATFRLFGVSTLVRILGEGLGDKNSWRLAILVISVAFASFHISLVGLWSQQPISTFLRTLVSGVILGYTFKEFGYGASAIAHASGNFLGFLTLAVV